MTDSGLCQNVQGIVNGWKSLFIKQPLNLAAMRTTWNLSSLLCPVLAKNKP